MRCFFLSQLYSLSKVAYISYCWPLTYYMYGISYSDIPISPTLTASQRERLCPRPPLTFSPFRPCHQHQHDDARPKRSPAHHPPSTVHVTESTPTNIPPIRSAQKTKIQRARVGGGNVLATPATRRVGVGRVCAQDRYRIHLFSRGRHALARTANTYPLVVCTVPPEPLPQRGAPSHKCQSCCDGQLVAWPVCNGTYTCELSSFTNSRAQDHGQRVRRSEDVSGDCKGDWCRSLITLGANGACILDFLCSPPPLTRTCLVTFSARNTN